MHRVFYRFFLKRMHPTAFEQILFGMLIGSVFGALLFADLFIWSNATEQLFQWEESQNILAVLFCGLLPTALAGLLFVLEAKELARVFIPAFSSAILVFSSFMMFYCGGCNLLFVVLLISGRLVSLTWLHLFLVQGASGDNKSFLRRLSSTVLLTTISLLFFYWLNEPSLRSLSIHFFK